MNELIKVGVDAMRARAREGDMDPILETLTDEELAKYAQAVVEVWGWPVGVGTLLLEVSTLLRGYEKHHRDRAENHQAQADIDASLAKAETNKAMADRIDERYAMLIEGAADAWPLDGKFAKDDIAITRRMPLFWGPVIGWYRTTLGSLGFVIESAEITGLVHVYPERGLIPHFANIEEFHANENKRAQAIIAKMSDYERDAWAQAIWEGEYHELPDLDQPCTLRAIEEGLIDAKDGGCVTPFGDRVIHLIERSKCLCDALGQTNPACPVHGDKA